jgi:conjugative transfer signal peptidase TraF
VTAVTPWPRWLVAGIAIGALALRTKHGPMLVYNASASAPVGFYRVLPSRPIHRGDLVLAPVPHGFAALADRRGYLPPSVPLVKRVAATAGDTVCALQGRVTIDGAHAGDQLAADRNGRRLPAWSGCRRLGPGEIFLLMADVPDSFDGRYFGPVPENTVIGRLAPLWVR